jgi:hypothetical protein
MPTLSSGQWTGFCYDGYQFSTSATIELTVSGSSLSGTMSVALTNGDANYSGSISGTVSGKQLTINSDPSGAGEFLGFWTDTPNSLNGATQAMVLSMSPGSFTGSEYSGGGVCLLWFIP